MEILSWNCCISTKSPHLPIWQRIASLIYRCCTRHTKQYLLTALCGGFSFDNAEDNAMAEIIQNGCSSLILRGTD